MSAKQQPTDRQLHRLVDGDLTETERAALLAVQGEERLALVAKVEGLWVKCARWCVLQRRLSLSVRHSMPMPCGRRFRRAWKAVARACRASMQRPQQNEILKPEQGNPKPFQVIQGGRAQERSRDPQIDERQKRVRTRRYGMMFVGVLAAAAAVTIIYLNPGGTPTEGRNE